MLSAAADEEGAAAIAYLAGLELRRSGIHINFSPVLDVNNNPDNPIIGVRSFGADPSNVTKMGLALIHGFKAAGVMSIVKHFPGHGDTEQDSHYAVPVVRADTKQMRQVHLAPFAAAIQQGVSGVMTGHVLYPALDAKNIATFSKPILQDLLKTRLGFQGLVVTDSLDMKSATAYCTIAGCAVRALESGADMILLGRYIKPLTVFGKAAQEVKEKNLQPRVEEAARKIFEAKRRMGLFDNEQTIPAPALPYGVGKNQRKSRYIGAGPKKFTAVYSPIKKTDCLCRIFCARALFRPVDGFEQAVPCKRVECSKL